jgi:hypothetical protein
MVLGAESLYSFSFPPEFCQKAIASSFAIPMGLADLKTAMLVLKYHEAKASYPKNEAKK